MAYTKNTWASGDTITSEKLNHLEQGVYDASQSGGGGGENFTATYTIAENEGVISTTCDKEYSDIVSAISGNKTIICKTTGVLIGQTSIYLMDDDSIVFTLPIVNGEGGAPLFYGIVHLSNDTITPITPS